MPASASRGSDHSNRSHLTGDLAELHRRLARSIVFEPPQRAVHPPSWLEHIPFAFWLVDVVRPSTFVELGTHSGNSYAAFAQAIQRLRLPTAAYAVDTWSGDSQAGFYDESVFAQWSAYHDQHFSAFSRLVRATFDEAAQHFSDGTIDLVHFDGCHIYDAVAADFATWRPKLAPGAVAVFHDINVRERDFGAWRLWEELRVLHPSFEFLHGHGLGVIGVGDEFPPDVQWLFALQGQEAHDVREFFARLGGTISARFAEHDTARRLQDELHGTHAVIAERDAQIAERTQSAARFAAELTAARADVQQREEGLAALRREMADVRAAHSADTAALLAARAEAEALRGSVTRRRIEIAELQHRLRVVSHEGRRPAGSPAQAPVPGSHPPPARGVVATLVRPLRRALRTPAALGLVPTRHRRVHRSGLRFLVDTAKLREARAVLATGLFDEAFYAGTYPDVRSSGMTPLAHYVLRGAREGRKPHPLFDGAYYLRHNPDVAGGGMNPLLHYRHHGGFEDRSPHPLFDAAYYLQTNADVRGSGIDPLSHFLRFGIAERRNPNPLFDTAYYLAENPDVAASGINPLIHFATDGWRECRRPSPGFNIAYYLEQDPGIAASGLNPLQHYFGHGREEGRRIAPDEQTATAVAPRVPDEPVVLDVHALSSRTGGPPTILCLSHVMPVPPRAGNEYRIYRMLRWLQQQGNRIVPVIAPLPGEHVTREALERLAAEFSNAVLCGRDGKVDYILQSVPDVLASLAGAPSRPLAVLLDEDEGGGQHQRDLLAMDRTFCHDVLITVATRLQEVLGPHVLLAEYIWMSRILPLASPNVIKVIDTIDVFSTKRDKVLRFGIDDLHVEEAEEVKRLQHADLVIAIQDDERHKLQRLLPGTRVVTVGVDFDALPESGVPSGRKVLYVGSDNPMNKKGLSDFLRFAWPQVRRAVPDAELLIVGRVGQAVRDQAPGVVRLGSVPDLAGVYRDARAIINPAVAGTGLKIKTIEALIHHRPVVTWPSGTDGVAPALAQLCTTVYDWFDFAQRVAALLATDHPVLFTAAERETIAIHTSPDTVYRPLVAALDALRAERLQEARN